MAIVLPVRARTNWPTPTAAVTTATALVRPVADGATSLRAIITSTLFLALFANCFAMLGGRAALAPLLRSAAAARQTSVIADVVLTMPGGRYCRHMSFDNASAEITEGGVEACPDRARPINTRTARGFAWGPAFHH
jgi:hypothetical protein